MSATPTEAQIEALWADIGDDSRSTFTDDEIITIWGRVSGAANEGQQHNAALALMCWQLYTQSIRLVNYRAGAISENLSDIRKGLKEMYDTHKPALDAATGTETRQFAKSATRGKPRQGRTEPGDYSDRRRF